MPTLSDLRVRDVMDLETFLATVRERVSPAVPETVWDVAPALLALANHPTFLADRIHAELGRAGAFQSGNGHTGQTLLLGQGPGFVVRANLWLPLAAEPHARAWQRRMFFYDVAHDHNFDLLTAGCLGAGYETDLYEYDRASVSGLPGEAVHLVSHGRARLSKGSAMSYRATRDVHVQLPPTEFSVSLNLLTVGVHRPEQLYFDVESARVRGPVASATPEHAVLCEAARYLCDGRTAPLLERIAATHPSGTTRVAALDSLTQLEPVHAERCWEEAVDSSHPYLRAFARRHVTAPEGTPMRRG